MQLPCENYFRYLTQISCTIGQLNQKLTEKFLAKVLDTQEISLRQARFFTLVDSLKKQNLTDDQIFAEIGISEMMDHMVLGRKNLEVPKIFALLAFLPVRNDIEKAVIMGYSPEQVTEFVNAKHGTVIGLSTITLYMKFFWKPMSREHWYAFLSRNDTFGYLSLIGDVQKQQILRAEISGTSTYSHEFDYIARKSLQKLTVELDDAQANPDNCGKWYKIFEASRAKSPVFLPGASKGDASDDSTFELGLHEAPNIPLKSVDEFVVPPVDDTPDNKG